MAEAMILSDINIATQQKVLQYDGFLSDLFMNYICKNIYKASASKYLFPFKTHKPQHYCLTITLT